MLLTTSARGRRPADEAWLGYAELARWAQWAPQIREVRASAPRLKTGVTGRVIGPLGVRIPFSVIAVNETRRTWSWLVFPGLLDLQLDHGVEPTGRGTRTWLRVHVPLPLVPVVSVYLPLANLALRRLVR